MPWPPTPEPSSSDELPLGTSRLVRLWCVAESAELDVEQASPFDERSSGLSSLQDPPSLMDAATIPNAPEFLDAVANDRIEEGPDEEDLVDDDMRRTMREALETAAEQIEEFSRQPEPEIALREEIAPRAVPSRGRISKLFFAYGYGLVETWDGKSVYFHENAVMGYGFSSLRVGDAVQMVVASDGAWGHRATAVMRVGRLWRTGQADS